MQATRLPNGNLQVPVRLETDGVIGDGVKEVEKGSDEYALWAPFVDEEDDDESL